MINLTADIGIIGRFDAEIQQLGFKHTTIETPFGVMDRLFIGTIGERSVAVIYGRFDAQRSMAQDINYEKTQSAFNLLGVKFVLGTFVVGSIRPEHKIGEVFIPDDFVGLGGYHRTLTGERPFKNVDMYRPFCDTLRTALIAGAVDGAIPVNPVGTYVCFHGFPRIETRAELKWYTQMGWNIVGQTLDPEATLARESGCCYAAVAVTIDEATVREDFLRGDSGARQRIQNAITEGRKKTTKIILEAVKHVPQILERTCSCGHRYQSEQNHFRHLPSFLLNDDD